MDRRARPAGPPAGPRPASAREAARYLGADLLPALERGRERGLATVVRRAADRIEIDSLGRLPERQRRHLLELLEERAGRRGRPPATPRALVALTTAIAGVPSLEAGLGRRFASPAR
ncbi:MAG TPA: hypothetical protein VMH78_06270 [Thermoplasmata archaeon]|nr:hypothetical protein [Thermoplasmata archaeon]